MFKWDIRRRNDIQGLPLQISVEDEGEYANVYVDTDDFKDTPSFLHAMRGALDAIEAADQRRVYPGNSVVTPI